MIVSVSNCCTAILFVHRYKQIISKSELNIHVHFQDDSFVTINIRTNIMDGTIQLQFLIVHSIVYEKQNGIVINKEHMDLCMQQI